MRTVTITCNGCGKQMAESGTVQAKLHPLIWARLGLGREQDVPRFIAMVPPSGSLPYHAADQPLEVCSWECAQKLLLEFISAEPEPTS
jgi:hypothetical protein